MARTHSYLDSFELTDNFDADEFRCRGQEKEEPCACHGAVLVNPWLVRVLVNWRNRMGFPVIIKTAFRCDTWNEHIGGHPRSYHRFGMASDCTGGEIRANMEHWGEIVAQIIYDQYGHGVGNVILYPENGFIHVDVGRTVDPDHMIRTKLPGEEPVPYDWRPNGGDGSA